MGHRILIFYGSYRSDRMGIRLAEFVVERFRRAARPVELIDAKAVNLPILDRMYKEYPAREKPQKQLERFGRAGVTDADGFVFITRVNIIGVSSPDLKTRRIISWREVDSGVRLRSQVIR